MKRVSLSLSAKFRGFTLLELLAVVGIIGLLSAVATAALNQARQRADIAASAQFEQSITNSLLADFESPVLGVWDMDTDAAGGSIVADTVHGNDLTVFGSASWNTDDVPLEAGAAIQCPADHASCLFINGNKLENDIELGAVSAPEVTLMTWFKLDALPSTRFIRAIQLGPNYIFVRVLSNGQLWAHSDNALAAIDLRYNRIRPGRWYHVAVSYDASSARLYINGTLEAVDEDINSVMFDPLYTHVYVGQGETYGANIAVWNPRVFMSTAFLE